MLYVCRKPAMKCVETRQQQMKTLFFCLLEDDKLISKVQGETNWLLTPPTPTEPIHEVCLGIRVKTIVARSRQSEPASQHTQQGTRQRFKPAPPPTLPHNTQLE